MSHRDHRFPITVLVLVVAFSACTVPNPNYRKPKTDGSVDGDGGTCAGCNLVPSNGLAKLLDLAGSQPDLNLGSSATIDTDTGEVKVGGSIVQTYSEGLAQPNGPMIRVFPVKRLVAKEVVVNGKNALAVVSAGDIEISGVLAASAKDSVPGAGAFVDGTCAGQEPPPIAGSAIGGSGGGGFGGAGAQGGYVNNAPGYQNGAVGGTASGNAELVPLRGGCRGGGYEAGAGGGAIQLVSRTQITITATGIVAANGGSAGNIGGGLIASRFGAGGGSGGGILLEAPVVEIAGRVVTNGAGGGLRVHGAKDGGLDATAAMGAQPYTDGILVRSEHGGQGGAGSSPATVGWPYDVLSGALTTVGGGGGGRIRVNTATGGIRGTGLFSPPPSTGVLASN